MVDVFDNYLQFLVRNSTIVLEFVPFVVYALRVLDSPCA